MNDQPLDWRGTPIEVGSIIVYPGRHSSYLWMNEGEVLSLSTFEEWGRTKPMLRVRRTREERWDRTHEVSGESTLTAVHRVTVVTKGE